ncbi:hypothetical protein N7481_001785 [Penicillium waksmanii]|uniref:uncharacterized protein n=1 Tax=Penicillium waksmanii TaxID=69791 RepID=UPI002547CFC6|nr:uncharacterized protein N7481_001785 [Penicillium waksmanii]KAJ5994808.1 hypothetical protein N7481_001785 [Penicillium waksmanii]
MCPYKTEDIADELDDATKHNVYQTARAQFLDSRSSWSVIFRLETGASDMNAPVVKDIDNLLGQRGINPSMILTWQCPMMLMAWSWVGYLVAIVVLISRPFIAPVNSDTDERKTAIFSLTFGSFMFLSFMWSSWFIYQASRSFKIISPRARLLPK